MSENKVLAKVNGREITEQDVNFLLESLGPQRGAQFNSEEGKKSLLQELINQEMFYLEAVENDIEKQEDFVKELERTKANMIKQYAIGKLLNDAKVEEEEIVKYYEENTDRFKQAEGARASHILVKEEEKANEILKEMNEGLSFEEAAVKYSTCPSKEQGGDLGQFTKGQMVPEFETVAFNMEKGEISKPVKTQFGYHIIKLVEKVEASVKSLDEVKEQIRLLLIGMKQNELYLNKTAELKKQYEVVISE